MTYTTIQGDTWDLISYRVYGSDHHTKELIFSNSKYSEVAVFGAGSVLNIPEIDIQVAVSIPPWLRDDTPAVIISDSLINISFERSNLFSYRFAEKWNDRVTEATRWNVVKVKDTTNLSANSVDSWNRRITEATII